METIERTGKTGRVFDAFKNSDFTGMTITEIHSATCIPISDLIVFFEKHSANSQKEDKYICKNGLYYLLTECR